MSQDRHLQQDQGQGKNHNSGQHLHSLMPVVKQKSNENYKLDEKLEKPSDHNRDWYGHPWEINLAENFPVRNKGVAGLCQAVCEISPCNRSSHVKKKRGYAIGRDICQLTKDDGEDDRIDKRLDYVPQRPQDSLLVEGDKVTFDEHEDQITILLYFSEWNVKPSSFGPYNYIPIFFVFWINQGHVPIINFNYFEGYFS